MSDTLFDNPPAAPRTDPMCCVPNARGSTCDPAIDGPRLDRLLDRVREVMLDGKQHTLAELVRRARGSEAGVSARIRELRRPECGGHTINRRRVEGGNGLHEYQMEATP